MESFTITVTLHNTTAEEVREVFSAIEDLILTDTDPNDFDMCSERAS
jgi:hypothetical protein